MKHLKAFIGSHNAKNEEKDQSFYIIKPNIIGAPDLHSITKSSVKSKNGSSFYITTKELFRKYKDVYKRYIHYFDIIISPKNWDEQDAIDSITASFNDQINGIVISFEHVIK